jgi:fructose-1,6-bisphosphatase/inositol monophosphatase family enzyme
MNLKEIAQVAITAARTAGSIIQQAAEEEVNVDHKEGGHTLASQVVTEIDRKCDAVIRKCLAVSCQANDIGILTEEQPDDGSRFQKACFWCVDPLDGTLAFINKEPGFSVSIALISKEGKPLIGVVYNPMQQVLYHAIENQGVYRNEEPWQPKAHKNNILTYVTDKPLSDKPKDEKIQSLIHKIATELELSEVKDIYAGGAVWNAIRVMEEAPALMAKVPKEKKGGGSIWDFAATACILTEAGYKATAFDGAPLELNKASDSYMNHQGAFYFSR